MLTDPEPSLLSRFKTNKNKITIETDPDGNPKIPTISIRDTYHVKTLQTMLRNYCTAHIRRSRGTLNTHLLTYDIQNTRLVRIAPLFHGRRCAEHHPIGLWRNVIPKVFPGQTHPRFASRRYSDFWITGDSVRKKDCHRLFGTDRVSFLMMAKYVPERLE